MSNQNQNTAVAKTAPKDLKQWLDSPAIKGRIGEGISKFVTSERVVSVALTTINRQPKLLQCTRESMLMALLRCAQFGLEPDGYHAHLIPYKDQATLIFDYKGLALMCMRSGEVAKISADVVRDLDIFDYEKGTSERLIHRPNMKVSPDERGPIYAAYVCVQMTGGAFNFHAMPKADIEAIKMRSSGYQASLKFNKESPWDTDWPEMAKKTVFRNLSKWLPLSPKLKEAINGDDDNLSEEDKRFKAARPAVVSEESEQPPTPPAEPDYKAEMEKHFGPHEEKVNGYLYSIEWITDTGTFRDLDDTKARSALDHVDGFLKKAGVK